MTEKDQLQAACPVYDGAFAWVLEDIRRVKPFPVRGQLGLFDVEVPAEEPHCKTPQQKDLFSALSEE
jgi:hypothetical protein